MLNKDQKPLTLEYMTETKDNNTSLGDFLKQQNLSKKAIIALKHRGGKICVNGEEKTTRFILHGDDAVTVTFPDELVSNSLLPIKMNINVVYEDDFLLVVDKKEGLPVIPTGDHRMSLANGIMAHYQQLGLKSTIHFVNRLDRGTSGLLIVAKYRHIHHLMTADMKAITRKYYALIRGILKACGRVDAQIYRPSATCVKRVVHPNGQRALTNYEVMQHFAGATLVKCTLKTGRTHQIRVHMTHIGHPIVNDPLYGDGKEGDMQLLHSYFLEFMHPISREKISFEVGIPSRFGDLY